LGDAVAHSLILRHQNNHDFRGLIRGIQPSPVISAASHLASFDAGLYGCAEMFVEGLLDLFRAGILKREVDGTVLNAGFFVGSRAFYRSLREMPSDVAAKFRMTSISYVNELYHDEQAKRRRRRNARFLNEAMMVTLRGDIVSDGLDDGRVVSGVGGQYNFVAQAFALEDARSIIMLRASRITGGKARSNIRWSYGHTTIPRHLRDIVVTEYGVADLRGKTDRDVRVAMLNIADSRWQDELLRKAKDAGKIERTFEISKAARNNTPDALRHKLMPARDAGLLPEFPFGSDFTEVEQQLLPVLQTLKSASILQLAGLFVRGVLERQENLQCLERLALREPRSFKQWLYAVLVNGALHSQ